MIKNFMKKKYGRVTILVLVLAIIDLVIKFLVVKFQPDFTVMEKFLRIRIVENMGSAWGLGENSLLNVIVSNVIVLGIILKFIHLQKERMDTKTLVSLSLILAGGTSNLLERIIRGRVTDYFQFLPQYELPIFNLADLYILCGWVMFAAILAYITGKKKTQRQRRQELLVEMNQEKKENEWND